MALSFVDPTDPTNFQDMRDRVHLDEKWFFLTREKERYPFSLKRKNQLIVCDIKSHIMKVMFLSVACNFGLSHVVNIYIGVKHTPSVLWLVHDFFATKLIFFWVCVAPSTKAT